MAENDNVPYKEQEDGSILAKVGLDENEQFEEETKEEVKIGRAHVWTPVT